VRFIGLDLIRCVAIGLLLMAHIGQTIKSPIGRLFGFPHFYYVSFGGLAVTIFLILSGVVIELQYGKKNINYLQFIVKRILRIYPVYYMSLLFGIVIYSIHSYNDTGHIFANFSKFDIGDIILSLTGGYAFVGKWGGPFVTTSWFVSLIITMYIFFPFLSGEIKKRPFVSISVLFLISVLSRLILGRYVILPTRPLDWFPLCRIFEFSLGIYLAIILPNNSYNFLKSTGNLGFVISFISALSFPLFLVHYPLLFIINYLTGHGVNQQLSIFYYVSITLIFSWIILAIDNKIPRSHILKRFDDICKRNKYWLTSG
jgi:peptidoglycan/LPS O-acetylase OafA/YrhL